MAKIWTTLETVLPLINPNTDLAVTVDGTSIFTSSRIFFEFDQKYTEWGFLQKPTDNSATVFRTLWSNYVSNMGEQLLHIWNGLNKEYDPTSNYSMIEMGADGHKQGKRTDTDDTDSVAGTKQGKRTDTDNTDSVAGTKQANQNTQYFGSEVNARSVTANQTTDRYENAFDSGISANGTHTNREVTTPASTNDTKSFNNREDSLNFENNQTQSLTSGNEIISATGNTANIGQSRNKKVEELENNQTQSVTHGNEQLSATGHVATMGQSRNKKVEELENNQTQSVTHGNEHLSATGHVATMGQSRNKKVEEIDHDKTINTQLISPTGERTDITMQNMADGSQHIFSRFGNIGVATAADMLMKEFELRKINLLKDFVHGFILEYCTYVGCDE